MRALALLVVLYHELRYSISCLLGLLVAAFNMEVEYPLERVESLTAIGVLRVEQEDTVTTTGKLVARQLYELIFDVGDDERSGLGAVGAVTIREQINRG